MKSALLAVCLLILGTASGQTTVNVSRGGNVSYANLVMASQGYPVFPTKYIRVTSGTPYFNEEWLKGKLISSLGYEYDSLRLRVDLVEDQVQFIGPKGQELIVSTAIRGVTLQDSITGEQHHLVHSSYLNIAAGMEKGWYEILASGRATLLKKINKIVTETKPYGSATTEQTIRSSTEHYLQIGTNFHKLKKASELPDLLSDKKQEVSDFLKTQKGAAAKDFLSVVKFYNLL